jgi:hypothetical protein
MTLYVNAKRRILEYTNIRTARRQKTVASSADTLSQALALIKQANDALARAASILRDSPEYDKLAFTAIRLEAETGMLSVEIGRARQRSSLTLA